ncbi:hypothetical protein PDJAM_G00231290 [Pangasius djambal]|uniref:Uncharacterized protein n=1 Tax=Pangasius djambal TaxID=1691987 RepID=A0ACC5YEG9_9TELE|nr:hypothetical protein [Pangasius djambal]
MTCFGKENETNALQHPTIQCASCSALTKKKRKTRVGFAQYLASTIIVETKANHHAAKELSEQGQLMFKGASAHSESKREYKLKG